MSSSSSSFLPVDVISSANAFILVKYSLMGDAPFDVVASTILVLMTHTRGYDVNMPSMVAQATDVVSMMETCNRISHEREDNR